MLRTESVVLSVLLYFCRVSVLLLTVLVLSMHSFHAWLCYADEPTSGLDARAAAVVIRAVRKIADSGRTVVVTVHQPSIAIFNAFDSLLLLARGGRTVYFGPLGYHSRDLIKYLEACPDVTPIKPGYNPAVRCPFAVCQDEGAHAAQSSRSSAPFTNNGTISVYCPLRACVALSICCPFPLRRRCKQRRIPDAHGLNV